MIDKGNSVSGDAALLDDPDKSVSSPSASITLALCGNPNAGKTTLFNKLTGLRAQTGNFAGTTIEHKVGRVMLDGKEVALLDLPGMYSFNAATAEERIAAEVLKGEANDFNKPDGVVVLADAENIERSLFLISQLSEQGIPMVVALNMVDMITSRAANELMMPIPICQSKPRGATTGSMAFPR